MRLRPPGAGANRAQSDDAFWLATITSGRSRTPSSTRRTPDAEVAACLVDHLGQGLVAGVHVEVRVGVQLPAASSRNNDRLAQVLDELIGNRLMLDPPGFVVGQDSELENRRDVRDGLDAMELGEVGSGEGRHEGESTAAAPRF